jgi:hypothetical protein
VVSFGPTGAVRSAGDASFPGLAGAPPTTQILRRRRRVPMATIIVSDTFGGSALLAVASDLVVQVRGTCLAATSPSVIELATGERIGAQALGGADVHALHTGQIDLVADSPEEAYAAVRRFLGVLPPDATTRARRVGGGAPLQPDDELEALAPSDRNRAYDVRELLGRVLDIGSLFELAHGYGAGLLVALARLDGHAVGVVASQPLHGGGALDPPACEKAVRLLCLCDAFDLPILFFQDVPGFAAGPEAEHAGMLKHAARLQTALALAQAPKLTVVLGRDYGPAYFALGGNDTVDAVYAWPGAAISFTGRGRGRDSGPSRRAAATCGHPPRPRGPARPLRRRRRHGRRRDHRPGTDAHRPRPRARSLRPATGRPRSAAPAGHLAGPVALPLPMLWYLEYSPAPIDRREAESWPPGHPKHSAPYRCPVAWTMPGAAPRRWWAGNASCLR